MKNLIKFSFLAVIVSIFAISCEPTPNPDQATGKDVRHADLAISDVFAFSTGETGGGKAFSSDSALYDVETVINPDTSRTTTITFDGVSTFEDGSIRGGQIIINWEFGWFLDSTKTTTVTFNDFSRDGNVVSGELELRFLKGSIAGGTKPTHEVVEKNMKLVYATGETTTWEGTRTVKWESGIATIRDRTDDVKLVDLFKDGTNRNGEHYIAEGTSLRIDNTCEGKAKMTSGTFTITKDDGTETLVDFGDGECDDIFTVTQGSMTITIKP